MPSSSTSDFPNLPPTETRARKTRRTRKLLFTFFRTTLVVAVLLTIFIVLWLNVIQVPNHNGLVNGSLLSVNSPIAGDLNKVNVQTGDLLSPGTPVCTIHNPRASDLELAYQHASSKLAADESFVKTLASKITERKSYLAKFNSLQSRQHGLDITYAISQLEQANHDLQQAQHDTRFAANEARRYTILAASGAVSAEQADAYSTIYRRQQELLKVKRELVKQLSQKLTAAGQGLQLDSNRTESYPAIQIEGVVKELSDLELDQADARLRIGQDEQDLVKTSEQLRLHRDVAIVAPETGVVYSVDAQAGSAVRDGQPIISLLSPENRWVETLVSESDASRLSVGQKAKVLVHSKQPISLDARIQSMQAGGGQVKSATEVVSPQVDPRRKEVRIRLNVIWPKEQKPSNNVLGPAEYYGVGRSVQVTFE